MLTLLSTWGQIQRTWGYEVRADYRDESGAIYNEVLMFERQPKDKKEIDVAAENKRLWLEARLKAESDAKAAEEKRVLTDAEQQAWSVVREKVLTYCKDSLQTSDATKDSAELDVYLVELDKAMTDVATAEKTADTGDIGIGEKEG